MSGERVQNRLVVTKPCKLLPFLVDSLKPMSRTKVKEMLQGARIRLAGQILTNHSHPLNQGDVVEVLVRGLVAQNRSAFSGLGIVYEDRDLIVIDKPAGLLSVATEIQKEYTAFALLGAQLNTRRGGRPFVVHRLDKDTSGLLIFARSIEARDLLQAAWPFVKKTYLAIVEGRPKEVNPRYAVGTTKTWFFPGKSQISLQKSGLQIPFSRVRFKPWLPVFLLNSTVQNGAGGLEP